jgi:hypothetical protein
MTDSYEGRTDMLDWFFEQRVGELSCLLMDTVDVEG